MVCNTLAIISGIRGGGGGGGACHLRDHSGCGLSQWEMALHGNIISYWLSPYPEIPAPKWSLPRLQTGILFNTLRPRQIGCHFTDAIFKCIFLNENVWILIKISLRFVPNGQINNIPALVQIMVCHVPATSHYLNQWWLVYWCIYASLSLNEIGRYDLNVRCWKAQVAPHH